MKLARKKQGSMLKLVAVLISVVVTGIISIAMVSFYGDMDKKDRVDITAREYLLSMETKGYLVEEDKEQMLLALAELGMTNISLSGTTLAEAGYGNKVTLEITGEIEMTSYTVLENLDLRKKMQTIPVHVKKSSTAKY
ncbi:hypothetical protein [Anaerobium acetethylicum]|uniref:Uncharacterized protein n=1 Tax=Anaerobium acetethylicum TaxID=1619234 RepID=A0A1D3TXH4_9FIRM|nr:hypothetical protein [Anaerobium acetethylicum]SCP99060.1 hypothetical protein SAMN05421730_103134 [Anaerobium acetethylicum]